MISIKLFLTGFCFTVLTSLFCLLLQASNSNIAMRYESTLKTNSGNTRHLKHNTALHTSNTSGTKQHQGRSWFAESVYWPVELERSLPKGFNKVEIAKFFKATSHGQVSSVSEGGPNACDHTSDENKLLVMSGGRQICARHPRQSNKRLPDGEVLSYHVSRLLGMDSVAPVVMKTYSQADPMWSQLSADQLPQDWAEGDTFNMNMWIEDLGKANIAIPEILFSLYHKNETLKYDNPELLNMSQEELVYLMQLTDAFLFDYLIDHGDRYKANYAEWPIGWQDVSIHETRIQIKTNITLLKNTAIHKNSQKIYLFDNENTFSEGETSNQLKKKYLGQILFYTVCIFRKSTIDRITLLHETDNLCKLFIEEIKDKDSAILQGTIMRKCSHYINHLLAKRIADVMQWIKDCSKQ